MEKNDFGAEIHTYFWIKPYNHIYNFKGISLFYLNPFIKLKSVENQLSNPLISVYRSENPVFLPVPQKFDVPGKFEIHIFDILDNTYQKNSIIEEELSKKCLKKRPSKHFRIKWLKCAFFENVCFYKKWNNLQVRSADALHSDRNET